MPKPTYDELVSQLGSAVHLIFEWLPDDQEEYKEEYDRAEEIERVYKRATGVLK